MHGAIAEEIGEICRLILAIRWQLGLLQGGVVGPRDGDAHGLHHVVFDLHDLDRVSANLETGAGFRDEFHVFEDQSIQRAWTAAGQFDFEVAIDVANVGRAVDEEAAVGILEKILV